MSISQDNHCYLPVSAQALYSDGHGRVISLSPFVSDRIGRWGTPYMAVWAEITTAASLSPFVSDWIPGLGAWVCEQRSHVPPRGAHCLITCTALTWPFEAKAFALPIKYANFMPPWFVERAFYNTEVLHLFIKWLTFWICESKLFTYFIFLFWHF